VNSIPIFASAVLLAASCGIALAGELPKCDEAAKLAWYKRAVAVTDGDAAPHEPLPEWCWPENQSAKPAAQRLAKTPSRSAAETLGKVDGALMTEQPGSSLRRIAIHDDTFSAED
jgi:hypothetical protein